MKYSIYLGLAIATAAALPGAAQAQDTIKVGVISAYSGQFADTANQIDNGIKLYMKQHGDTVAGKKIEIVRKDTGGPNPDVAKRLAQELIVRDKADILAGFTLTPEALGAAGVATEAKKLMVDMNAATSVITEKSPYIVRVSMTLPQIAETLGDLGGQEGQSDESLHDGHGLRPRHRCRDELPEGVQGCRRRRSSAPCVCRWRTRISRPSCSAPRTSILNPIFVFVPGGAQPGAIGKAFAERGMDPNKIKILSTGEAVDETAIKALGDLALGRISAWHYDYNHKSKMNEDFVKAFNAEFKRNPDFFAVGGYDGMHLIYEALKKTGGKADGDSLIAAAKGMKWESPRGPMMIDAATRDVVQNVYIRKVEKVGGQIVNVDMDVVKDVKDPTHK